LYNATRRRGNAHRTEKRKVLYLWHPWAGCTVRIHEVIDKVAGAVARYSHDEGATGGLLELPLWMFDRSACAPMLLLPNGSIRWCAPNLNAPNRCRIEQCPQRAKRSDIHMRKRLN